MCGRTRVSAESIEYASSLAANASADVEEASAGGGDADDHGHHEFGAGSDEGDAENVEETTFRPCENCIPGRQTPIVLAERHGGSGKVKRVKVRGARWGLIPSYTKAGSKLDFFRMNNARMENMGRIHARLIKRMRRCVVVVAGFYEWKLMETPTKGKMKQPFYLHMKNEKPLMFAGFYDVYRPSEGEKMKTYTIITMPVSDKLKWLHHRMPAVLPTEEAAKTWLTSDDWEACKRLLVPDNESLAWYPVTPRMGRSTYQETDCSKPIVLEKAKNIKSFFASSSLRTPAGKRKGEEDQSASKRVKHETGKEESEDEPMSMKNRHSGGKTSKKRKGEEDQSASKRVKQETGKEESGDEPMSTKNRHSGGKAQKKRKPASPTDPKQKLLTGFFQKQKG